MRARSVTRCAGRQRAQGRRRQNQTTEGGVCKKGENAAEPGGAGITQVRSTCGDTPEPGAGYR